MTEFTQRLEGKAQRLVERIGFPVHQAL